jgi:hypothetical protein
MSAVIAFLENAKLFERSLNFAKNRNVKFFTKLGMSTSKRGSASFIYFILIALTMDHIHKYFVLRYTVYVLLHSIQNKKN